MSEPRLPGFEKAAQASRSRPGDPLTKQRSAWQRLGPAGDALAVAAFGSSPATTWRRNVSDGKLTAIVADEPTGWHMSISYVDNRGSWSRYPSWDEIAHARYELLPADLDFVMHLPPPADYVAAHPTTFHLHQHPEVER